MGPGARQTSQVGDRRASVDRSWQMAHTNVVDESVQLPGVRRLPWARVVRPCHLAASLQSQEHALAAEHMAQQAQASGRGDADLLKREREITELMSRRCAQQRSPALAWHVQRIRAFAGAAQSVCRALGAGFTRGPNAVDAKQAQGLPLVLCLLRASRFNDGAAAVRLSGGLRWYTQEREYAESMAALAEAHVNVRSRLGARPG